MIFAVLDPSPLTVCINCSFFTFIIIIITVKSDRLTAGLVNGNGRGRWWRFIRWRYRYQRQSCLPDGRLPADRLVKTTTTKHWADDTSATVYTVRCSGGGVRANIVHRLTAVNFKDVVTWTIQRWWPVGRRRRTTVWLHLRNVRQLNFLNTSKHHTDRQFVVCHLHTYTSPTTMTQVDSYFYPPWDGKMSTSQRAVMLCGWGVKADMACLQATLVSTAISALTMVTSWYIQPLKILF